jgi:Eukaryotic aspartyl protease
MARKAMHELKKPRQFLSAAAALGGKMSTNVVRMPITNVYVDGDYTGLIYVGSQKRPANVLLDTGSSSLAVDGTFYDATTDDSAHITNIAQEVPYADGSSWIGGIVKTDVVIGTGKQIVTLPRVNVAAAYHETRDVFGNAQGILGLAYTRLNKAYEMPGPTIPPKYTFNEIQSGRVTYPEPYFTQLEAAGLVANKFAFYARRSQVNRATAIPADDPLNKGVVILGGGEESTDLYKGPFQVARVLDDLYYNTNLKAVIVGKGSPITVPPPTKASGNTSNSIVDSGTNSLTLDQHLFNQILKQLSPSDDASLSDSLRAGYVAMSRLNLKEWPTLTFVLEGALGIDVRLEVPPETYWQTNSPRAGHATAVLYGDEGSGKGQSILGLPLLNRYFTIFDRSVDRGLGAISFAPIKR